MKPVTQILMMLLSVLMALGALAQGDNPQSPGEGRRPPREGEARGNGQYTLEQAISDRAQLTTIAFSGLAFITGDFGASTFLPLEKSATFSVSSICVISMPRDKGTIRSSSTA